NQPDGRARFEELSKKRLEGCIVLTRYNNKPYRIDEVKFDITPKSEFTLSNGQKVTYLDYFKRHWNIEIRDPNQPMLVHQPRKKGQPDGSMICLVPELSFMTGLTDDIRSDFRVMRDLAQHTRIKPAVRNQKLIEFVRNVNTNEESRKTLEDWGFILEDTTLKTQARQIAPEQMFFGNNKTITVNPKAEWANDARNSTLLQAIPVQRWVMIFTRRDAAKADEFVRSLQQVSRNMGFDFANPRRVEIMDDTPLSYCNAIKNSTSGAQLVVIMTPGSSQREDRYGAIKKLCYGDLGLSCQVVREKTLQGNKMRAVCQNIALQITCKLGGQLWGIKIPFQSCMIIGMDVYHDPMIKEKSVIGMVASMNQGATKWFTRVYNQGKHQEVASTLQTGFIACLRKYYETTNSLPQRIFVFRDGVGDGDLPTVRDYEITQMENAITDIVKSHKGPRPLLSVVVVQKRINLKMFMRNRQTNDLDNPPPGSIIDHTVTRRIFYDFYLISQHVSQGTVTPSHYITLYDKNEMTPDRMQKITYKMTHLYYNFPST
ncbi:piwi-like protein 2, partial [Leptotrombidium deliense]